jgi:two-component system NtrC family sensor kinase
VVDELGCRIGAGDFSEPLRLRREDELSALADDMNAMCEQLASAAARIAKETARRIQRWISCVTPIA